MILPLSALYLAGHGAYRALGFRSRTLRTDVRNLHIYDRAGLGRAPPVLLVHGMGGNAYAFLPLLRTLVRVSRRVTAVELPRHGRSPLRAGGEPAGVLECAQAVGAALLDIGEPAVLVGNSLGGAICLHCAIALPDKVVGVVGLNPAGAPLAGADREAVLRAFTSTTPRAALEMN